jgi:AraC family transcriptional regulator, transcriptional activator of pobA
MIPYRIQSITDLHALLGDTKPMHPLITLIDYAQLPATVYRYDMVMATDFYLLSMKAPAPVAMQYGRQHYDFAEGSLICVAPGQVFAVQSPDTPKQHAGWGLFFHPDLLHRTSLAAKMKDFTFFGYDAHEALHLSETEKATLSSIVQQIHLGYSTHLDAHSQNLIVAAIELLLHYCQRFYSRQFITRQRVNSDVLARFEQLLQGYFQDPERRESALPSVNHFAEALHLSPGYLGDLLRHETGQSTKAHIQAHVIHLAKQRLLASDERISDIAYALGFSYPHYFSRLFKQATGMTPQAYRQLN